jgi:ribosomal protein S18 acetylase RimI-like enzyme
VNTGPPPSPIRLATPDTFGRVLGLWLAADADPTVTDTIDSLGCLHATDPEALLIAEENGDVIGTLIAAWNGWRGSLYRLAVHPRRRRQGVATCLVREGERRLRDRGALRIDAIIADDDPAAEGFWNANGYARQQGRSRFVRNL